MQRETVEAAETRGAAAAGECLLKVILWLCNPGNPAPTPAVPREGSVTQSLEVSLHPRAVPVGARHLFLVHLPPAWSEVS